MNPGLPFAAAWGRWRGPMGCAQKSENFQLLALHLRHARRTLRRPTPAARQPALEEDQLLAQLAYSNGERYHPASDFPPDLLPIGSVYSSAWHKPRDGGAGRMPVPGPA
jgi:hypothetical protein